MQTSLEKLRKFFRLEHENGYANTAIIGGLAEMLNFWEGEARADSITEEVIQAVVQRLRSYDGLSPQSRADALKGLWKRIGDAYPEAQQKPKAPSQVEGRQESARPPQQNQNQPKVESEPRKESHPQHQQRHEQRPRPPAPPRSESVAGARTSATPAALDAKLTVLQGVGPKNAETFAKLGMVTLGDMLYYYPRRYDDYSQLKPIKELFYGEQVTVIGTIDSVHTRPIRGGKASIVEVIISDGTGGLRLSYFNQPWLANRFKQGNAISVSGKVDQYLGRLVMNSPDWESVEVENLHTNRIVPIYPLAERITQKWLRNVMKQVVEYFAPAVVDSIPESVRNAARVMPLGEALLQIHFPSSQEKLKAARERLAFDEIFYLQMGVLRQRRDWQSVDARRFVLSDGQLDSLKTSLPFTLTSAQERAIADIRADLDSGKPMNRLLQGDVGSGKTVVAALAAAVITSNNAQAAIMAPTSILAEQHYRNFTNLLKDILKPEEIRLLVGDTPESEKEQIRAGLADGSIKIVIGTHAVIEGPVQFKDLQLAVIDEQHRFGVEQRGITKQRDRSSPARDDRHADRTRSPSPSTATSTPASWTKCPLGESRSTRLCFVRKNANAFTLRGQIKDGKQAFIIYPLIGKFEKIKRAAVDDYGLSRRIFPDLKLGLLHGKMRPSEKDDVEIPRQAIQHPRFDHRRRSRRGCSECDRHADRRRGPIWSGATASTPRARRSRRGSIVLSAHPHARRRHRKRTLADHG
ncbi:MAG: DEAD/DEAH box helicase [Anaerolineales bacterium]